MKNILIMNINKLTRNTIRNIILIRIISFIGLSIICTLFVGGFALIATYKAGIDQYVVPISVLASIIVCFFIAFNNFIYDIKVVKDISGYTKLNINIYLDCPEDTIKSLKFIYSTIEGTYKDEELIDLISKYKSAKF